MGSGVHARVDLPRYRDVERRPREADGLPWLAVSLAQARSELWRVSNSWTLQGLPSPGVLRNGARVVDRPGLAC